MMKQTLQEKSQFFTSNVEQLFSKLFTSVTKSLSFTQCVQSTLPPLPYKWFLNFFLDRTFKPFKISSVENCPETPAPKWAPLGDHYFLSFSHTMYSCNFQRQLFTLLLSSCLPSVLLWNVCLQLLKGLFIMTVCRCHMTRKWVLSLCVRSF
jgi:hypothetical protein